MKDHCYWPLVSDFNNVLSHESVALVFLRNDKLVEMWFQFLFMLQGMNVNERETGTHVEYEPGSYYAAFSCELEASAYPMWSIISHLKDATHTDLANNILRFCINYLQEWLDAIFLYQPKIEPVRFHFCFSFWSKFTNLCLYSLTEGNVGGIFSFSTSSIFGCIYLSSC